MAALNAVARSAVARTMSFVPTAVATLLTSRLIIHEFGITSFDSYALVLTLISLVPLNNLGVGAAVTSAYAADGPASEHSRRVTLTAARTLAVSTIGTAVVALLIAALGAWPTLLGAASGPNLYCGLSMAIYAVSFLPGLGQSMLLGVHRNHVTIVVQTFFTPLILLGVIVVIVGGVAGEAAMLVPPSALVVVNVVTCWFAARATGISWRWVLRALPWPRLRPGASIRALSGPVLLITLTAPIALQSDRIVLSHVSSTHAVANYSVAMQIFAPALALIAASAQPLWPIYTDARARGERGPALIRMIFLFCAAATAISAVLLLIADPIGHLIGGGQVDLGWLLPFAAGLLVLATAASYPIGMSLMDPAGARFVGILAVIALPLNLALSIVLARAYGAPGPLFGSVVVAVLVQTVPALLYSRGRLSTGRHRLDPVRPNAMLVPASALIGGWPTLLDEVANRRAELATDR
ncbi:MAG: lipopolysaccharide biosynthesis protein [Jatrophihabitantaceae bacterium]